jgi:hypothetical protein
MGPARGAQQASRGCGGANPTMGANDTTDEGVTDSNVVGYYDSTMDTKDDVFF